VRRKRRKRRGKMVAKSRRKEKKGMSATSRKLGGGLCLRATAWWKHEKGEGRIENNLNKGEGKKERVRGRKVDEGS